MTFFKARFKKVLSVLCVTVMLLALASLAGASGTPQPVLDAREGVVRIAVDVPGMGWLAWGTGFVIAQEGGKTYIATNRHCVIHDFGGEIGEVLFDVKILRTTIQGVLDDAKVIFIGSETDPTMDVVVLEVTHGHSHRPVLPIALTEEQDIGQAVYLLGFPGVGDGFTEISSDGTSENITITNGILSNTNSVFRERAYLQHSAESAGGNSGGPLFNARGEVIGIHTAAYTPPNESPHVKAALSTSYLIDFCRNEGIPLTRLDMQYTPGGEEGPYDDPNTPPAEEDNNLFLIIGIAAGGAVLIIIIVVVLILSSKKKPVASAVAPAPAAPAAPAAASHRAYLKALSGTFAGKTYDVGNKIIIGRDASQCSIAFPVDSAGISGIHCEIYFEGSTAYLRDLGSSYGTFLGNGTKLAPKAPHRLNNGDKFYVANEDNRFEFTIM
jgi:hypothetical protein